MYNNILNDDIFYELENNIFCRLDELDLNDLCDGRLVYVKHPSKGICEVSGIYAKISRTNLSWETIRKENEEKTKKFFESRNP